MRKEYDFSKGRRGTVEPMPSGKSRITIRLDSRIITWFRSQTEARGGGNYQTLINEALNEYIRRETLENMIRRVIREESCRTSSTSS